jgi:hypothetical protein
MIPFVLRSRFAFVLVSGWVSACAPSLKLDGKQGAADAMFAAWQRSKLAADWPMDPDPSCPLGGTARIAPTSTAQSFIVTYEDCGVAQHELGLALYRGELAFTQSIYSVSSVFDQPPISSLSQNFKGRLLVQGGYDDFLEVELLMAEPLGPSSVVEPGTQLSAIVTGTLRTNEGKFTFSEPVSAVSGKISSKLDANR